MTVAAVIVNYNGLQYTVPLLACLVSLLDRPDLIVVVDNGSTQDESVHIDQLGYPAVVTLRADENRGFAAGCNRGIRHALREGADFVLLLNHDVLVHAGAIAEMVRSMREGGAAIVSPLVVQMDNERTIWAAGGEIDLRRGVVANRRKGEPSIRSGPAESINFAPGCALMVASAVIDDVGLLDEGWFLYFEDTDYSLRVISRGHKILYVPTAIVEHAGGVATRGTDLNYYYYWRNYLLFLGRHAKGWARIRAQARVLATIGAIACFNLAAGRIERSRLVLAAAIGALRGEWGRSVRTHSASPNG